MRPRDHVARPALIKWLLDSDPAIRWQVMRDLTGEAPDAIAAERSRIAREGWGAELLARQSRDGKWGGAKEDETLLTTFNALCVLKDLGLDPVLHGGSQNDGASRQAAVRVARPPALSFTARPNPASMAESSALGSYFKEPDDALANQLLAEQLEDGGWNCEAPKSRRSSFHTTICVLEGLLDYERAGRRSTAVTKARRRAENYLLERHLFRSLRTGEVIEKQWLRFPYPTFWHYDVLRGLDYLRNAGIKPDCRVDEAIEVVM